MHGAQRLQSAGPGLPHGADDEPRRPGAHDARRDHPRFQGENVQRTLDLVARVQEIAREKGCTPAQLALAWVLAQGEDVVPIPGTKRRRYLEENAGALQMALAADNRARIDVVAPRGVAVGERSPPQAVQAVSREGDQSSRPIALTLSAAIFRMTRTWSGRRNG
jgi:hypothetical protein